MAKTINVRRHLQRFLFFLFVLLIISSFFLLSGCRKILLPLQGSSIKSSLSENKSEEKVFSAESAQISKKNEQAPGEKQSHETEVTEAEEKSNEGIEKADADKILFTFTVAGDNRPANDSLLQPEVFTELLGYMQEMNPVFFINTGDIINGGTSNTDIINRQFNDYLAAAGNLDCINFISPGNHDVANNTSKKLFVEMINKPVFVQAESENIEINENIYGQENNTAESDFYYYFKYGNVSFIILNAYENGEWGAVRSDQLEWLENILYTLKNDNVFVFVHPPVYSFLNPECITDGSKHVAFSGKKNQDYIRKLFKEFKVDAVFSGHEHMYYREFHDGTEYIITGCSGAYPYASKEEGGFYHFIKIDVAGNSWTYSVIDEDGKIFLSENILFN